MTPERDLRAGRLAQGRLGRGWAARLAIVLVGAFAALGFAPLHVWPATLAALAILYIRVREVSRWDRPGRSAFGTGLLFGLGWFSASCFWIASAFIERGPEFLILIPPLVGGLAVLLSLFWGAAAGVSARLMRERASWAGPVVFTASFTLAELARGHVLSGFPWNMAGYAFAPGGALSQSASLFGIYGLTMVVLLVAALAGQAVLMREWRSGAASAVLLASLFAFGAVRLASAPPPDRQPVHPGVTLRLVNVPFRQSDKLDPERSFAVVRAFIDQSVQPGLAGVTHVVWPEGAVNGLAIENGPLLRAMGASLVAETKRPPVWLMNSLRQEISPDSRTGRPQARYYNSAVAVTFDAAGNPAIAATDDKRKLVPFGEFIPGGEIVERLGARLVSTALGSITGAEAKRTARFPGLPPLSAQICYEVIFPGLTPANGTRPAFILNQSNDAWFGDTTGPAQHAAIARYRAIEEGLPMVRAAANGVTGVFDPYGRTVVMLTVTEPSHIDTTLPKPLNRKQKLKVVNFIITLLNLCLVVIVRTLRRST